MWQSGEVKQVGSNRWGSLFLPDLLEHQSPKSVPKEASTHLLEYFFED